jgi:hypothetical protein
MIYYNNLVLKDMKKIALVQVLFSLIALVSCSTPVKTALLPVVLPAADPVSPFTSANLSSTAIPDPASVVSIPQPTIPPPILSSLIPGTFSAPVSGNQPTPAGARFDYYRINDKKDTELDFFIRYWDKYDTMVPVDGVFSIKIWAYDQVTFATGEVILHWENMPVSKASFVDGMGMPVVLSYYDNFIPRKNQWGWVQAVFTSSSQTYTVEHPLAILFGG